MEINNAEVDVDDDNFMALNGIKLSSYQKSFLARNRLCFSCGNPGHRSADCTIPTDKAKSKLFSVLKGAKPNYHHKKSYTNKYKHKSKYGKNKRYHKFNNVDLGSNDEESDSQCSYSSSSLSESESEHEKPTSSKYKSKSKS